MDVRPQILEKNPKCIKVLRMATAPPIARDRLSGLAKIPRTMVEQMENQGRVPPKMNRDVLYEYLEKIGSLFEQLADRDLFIWLTDGREPTKDELARASIIVADRLCGADTDPIIRNTQETRQLGVLRQWLGARGYREINERNGLSIHGFEPGTFAVRFNTRAERDDGENINIPIDIIIMPIKARHGSLPLMVEAKSAGDFTNVNKRRKEEGMKMRLLKETFGMDLQYILFLCGYFDTPYLGFEAAEGIDWVWEHRVEDLAKFGV
jgi:hypothetical protein